MAWKEWHCDGCKTHYLLHKGGKNLPCSWCEAHAEDTFLIFFDKS